MNTSQMLDTPITVAALVFGVLGALLLLAGLRRLWRRRWLRGTGTICGGGFLLALAALMASIAFNFYSYHRLTFEQDVAMLRFRQMAPQHYMVDLTAPDGTGERYELRGDQWQIDARVIKWQGVANLLGLDARYRLERLSGRYGNIEQERQATRTVHGLTDAGGVDLFTLAREHPRWIPWLDTDYGSAAYLPMADGAEYRVRLTQSGLIARPSNEPARQAISRWQ